MANVFLSLGTNLGDKEQNLCEAIHMIEKQIGKVISRSAFYITEPWGFDSDNSFLNAVIETASSLLPLEILTKTQEIEKEMGRSKKSIEGKYSDRIIDIDILLYDDLIYQDNKLQIPHPFMSERLFVMEPLAEIAPSHNHPVSGKTFLQIKKELLRG